MERKKLLHSTVPDGLSSSANNNGCEDEDLVVSCYGKFSEEETHEKSVELKKDSDWQISCVP